MKSPKILFTFANIPHSDKNGYLTICFSDPNSQFLINWPPVGVASMTPKMTAPKLYLLIFNLKLVAETIVLYLLGASVEMNF